MTEIGHTLIVGGTGMLRAASVALARSSRTLTSIARTRDSLEALDSEIDSRCAHHRAALDYRLSAELRVAIAEAVARSGPVELGVAWVHETAPEAPLIIAEEAARSSARVRFFHVLGSGAAGPRGSLAGIAAPFAQIPALVYHQVVLGFILSASGSRWLTDVEISSGVLDAIARGSRLYVVGTVHPWSARP